MVLVSWYVCFFVSCYPLDIVRRVFHFWTLVFVLRRQNGTVLIWSQKGVVEFQDTRTDDGKIQMWNLILCELRHLSIGSIGVDV